MVATLLLALWFQGPTNLQVAPDAVVKPPLVVPAGTAIPVALINRISTKNAKDGDGVYARTVFPITVNNEIVIPEGSYVRGRISEVMQPGRIKGKAGLVLSFQQLVLPSGLTVELYASLGGASGVANRQGEAGLEGESSTTDDTIAVGTAAGQGAIVGAIGDGWEGAALGGGIGAGVGLAGVLLTRGKDLVLEPGATLEIVLDRPLEP